MINADSLQTLGAVLGVLGLLLSLLLAYFGHFRPPKIQILPGDHIQFYPAPSQGLQAVEFLGAVAFYLPLTVHNWSTRGGVLYKVRLVFRHDGEDSRCYDMQWAEFAELSREGREWISARYAQPLPVGGRSSRTEMVQFQWRPDSEQLKVKEGYYKVLIFGWTKPRAKPQIVFKTHTSITAQQARNFEAAFRNKKALTIELPLGEDSQMNRAYPKDDLEIHYRELL